MTDEQAAAGADGQDLDVEGFAHKHGISLDEARQLIEEIGYDRGRLDFAAQKLKLDRG